MHPSRLLSIPLALGFVATAHAEPWAEDAAFSAFENTAAPSCKVDAADLNGDGFIDLVFANTNGTVMGDPNSPLPQQAFANDGVGGFTDISAEVFGGVEYNGRAVKVRDIDNDGDNDIILGTAWITQTQLFINDNGTFINDTDPNLPQRPAGISDLEVGDVDDDGDLDIALANWGEDPVADEVVNSPGAGGVTLLWSQEGDPDYGAPGSGMFADVTAVSMPSIELRMAWDLEFFDFDNDYKLDIVVSCDSCTDKSLYLFQNDGQGLFTNIAIENIQGTFGKDVEVIDLNDDKFLDLVSLHDGQSSRNRVLTNNNGLSFALDVGAIWPQGENPPSQDHSGAFYDYDSDGDPDLVLGALTAGMVYPDRLIENQSGTFKQWGPMNVPPRQALEETSGTSSGTCSIVLADLNGDHKLDVAMSQFDNSFDKFVYFATNEVANDTAPPIINNYQTAPDIGGLQFPGEETLRLRAHDNKSPLMLHDFQADGIPYIEGWTIDPSPDPDVNPGTKTLGEWYGEYLWRVTFEVPDADEFWYRFCAIDAAGNKTCTPVETTTIAGGTETETDTQATDSETMTAATDSVTVTDTGSASDTDTLATSDESTFTSMASTQSMDSDSNSDSLSATQPTETFTAGDSESLSDGHTTSESNSETLSDSDGLLDDGGCICRGAPGPMGGLVSLLLFLGLRRRRSCAV